MRFLGSTGNIFKTRRYDVGGECSWEIGNFFSHTGRGGDFYTSPDFLFCDAKWCLRLFLYGETQDPTSDWLSLYLQRKKPLLHKAALDLHIPKVHLRITVGIKGSDGQEKAGGEHEFSKYDEEYGWSEFWSRSELKKHESRLVPGNTLTIICVLKRDAPSGAASGTSLIDVSTQTDDLFNVPNTLTGETQLLDKKRTEKVVEDIGKLLISGENSDVTLQVNDTEFKVHSAILSVRSPALWAAIHSEAAEKASDRTSVSDCEPDVFEAFLRYVYTGSVQSITEQNVFGLYRVADTYLAGDLKQLCLGHIRDTLCLRTFCDTLKLALAHEESGLLQLAVDFATENIRLIISSVQWRNFNREYPSEATEVLIKSLGPSCECKKSKGL